MTAHTHGFQELFEEMKAKLRKTMNRFLIYITATIILPALKQVKIILFILEKRKPFSKRRIMLDCNELAKEKYFKLSGLSISDDNQLLHMQ
jgi:protease II